MTITWKSRLTWLGAIGIALVISACGGGHPEEEPEPQIEPEPQVETRDLEAERRAREEAERRRLEEEERRRREAERRRVETILTERVHFDFDRSDIRSDAEDVLQRKVAVLREFPGVTLRIEGNCDERGSNEYNLALGQRRAEARVG